MPRVRLEDWTTEDSLLKIKEMARDGLTDKEIWTSIGVGKTTYYKWCKENTNFSNAIKKGREAVRVKLEDSLFRECEGYWVTETTTTTQPNGKKSVIENHRYIRPSTTALIFANKKWNPDRYSDNTEISNEPITKYVDIPSKLIASPFHPLHFDVEYKNYSEFVLPGGRGSAKSSFASLQVIDLIEKNPEFHALVCRSVGATLKDSVYNQIKWAIEELGLSDEYKTTKNPLEIVKKSTGQTIYFRGSDDPTKIKGIKPTFGHIGVIWLEELDQFRGEEEVRNIEQSAKRGGDDVFVFKTFNPPRSKNNWANMYVQYLNEEEPSEKRAKVYPSTYLQIPKQWLGEPFFIDAEDLKKRNPEAYKNEYLGEANGSGGNVLPNIVERRITDEEIASFDNIVNGVDWGWVHPSAFIRAQYDVAQQRLIVFDEAGGSYMTNEQFAKKIKEKGIGPHDLIVCDSAEPKSVIKFQELGLRAAKAKKGPNSRDFGFKWLASQIEIVVDPKRTPRFYEQAINLEYERDKEGNVTSLIPKIDDDWPDALRYATEQFSNRTYNPFD